MKKYHTCAQREVELSSPEVSMMEKVPKQRYVEIQAITFNNDDHTQIDNTGNIIFA